MEYAGAGSFWNQLSAASEGEFFGSSVQTRRMDELLRQPDSSLIDILLDEEAISEFRSCNEKLISRITSPDGLVTLVGLILGSGVPDNLTDAQKLQLPFIATEVVACELDRLTDALVHPFPGKRLPIARLFDYLTIDNSESSTTTLVVNSTVLGYVCRSLNLLVQRRGQAVNRYIESLVEISGDSFFDSLITLSYDRSVCDLILKLLIEEDSKYFAQNFSLVKLFSRWQSSPNTLYVFESIFSKFLLPSERMVVLFKKLAEEWSSTGAAKITPTNPVIFSIYRLLISFCFNPNMATPFSELSTPPGAVRWESGGGPISFSTKSPRLQEEDNCLFDDSMESPPAVSISLSPVDDPSSAHSPVSHRLRAKYPNTMFTEFGIELVREAEENFFCANVIDKFRMDKRIECDSSDGIPLTTTTATVYSFILLVNKMLSVGWVPEEDSESDSLVEFVTSAMFPKSSALHNAVVDILSRGSEDEASPPHDTRSRQLFQKFALSFIPKAVAYLETASMSEGGCYGHVCRILSLYDNCAVDDGVESHRDILRSAGSKWTGMNKRLTESVSAAPSVQKPKFDMDEEQLDPPALSVSEWQGTRPIRMYQANRTLSDDDDDFS